jgi:hypothetical protein
MQQAFIVLAKTEYFACARSNVIPPSSITTALLLPARKSPRAAARVSEVMPEGLHKAQGLVCDA